MQTQPQYGSQPDNQDGNEGCLELWTEDRYYFNDVNCAGIGGVSPLCETTPLDTTAAPATTEAPATTAAVELAP